MDPPKWIWVGHWAYGIRRRYRCYRRDCFGGHCTNVIGLKMRTELTEKELRDPLIEACITAVLEASRVKREDLFSASTSKNPVKARHALIWLLRSVTTLTYAKIGWLLDRDHTSCDSAYWKFKARYDVRLSVREWMRRVRRTALYRASEG